MDMKKTSKVTKKISIFILQLVLSLSMLFLLPTTSAVIPEYDVNSDGHCNVLDFVLIANRLGDTGSQGWIREDVDNNGIIDLYDIYMVSENYGETGWTNDDARIQKLSIAYGSAMGNTANQEFIATHFDMVDCPRSYLTAATNVKALNSDMIVLGYFDVCAMSTTYPDWNEVTQHEDWFVHDINGNRVQPAGYPTNYFMNPNSGWSDYIAQQCQQYLISYPQFDGIFADDVLTNLIEDGLILNIPYSELPSEVLSNWGAWTYQNIQSIQVSMGNKILMPNAYKHLQFCQGITHVHFWEHFIHGRNKAYNENGYGTDGWNYGLLAIDLLHEQAELGNIIAVNSGCADANAHPVEAKRWMLFTYACFSFAVVDVNKAYYAWQFYNSDSTHGYYPEMDINLGQPIGDYYHVSGTPRVYAREFGNYYVAANLDLLGTSPVTFTIHGISNTLSPRTAVFIEK